MASPAGGIDIEEVAAKTPDKIMQHPVDPRYGLQTFEAMELAFFLYSDVKQVRAAAKILQQLYQAFVENGGSLAEINPLVTTPAGDVVALDAKMVIDDNELDRRPDIAALRDESSEDPSEVDARKASLTFIKLDGNVGCVVNGAGLAMATMDLVKYYGGEPANFLDIGGSSNPEKVVAALRIITGDPNVKAILFNIFGGITRTDDVANGIVTAIKQNPLKVPLVIRLTGTNEEIALKILTGERVLGDDRHGRSREESRCTRDRRKSRVSIFIDKSTRLLVQGITGRDGSFHAKQMIEYGTKVVGGVTPGKAARNSRTRFRSSTPSQRP